jgi:hypothetical protein
MTNTAASNAGVGRAIFATRLKLTLKAIEMSFWFGFVPTLLLVCFTWLSFSSDQDVDMAKIGVMAHFADPGRASRWYLRDADGERKVVVAKGGDGREYWSLTPAQVRKALSNEWGMVRRAVVYGWAALFVAGGWICVSDVFAGAAGPLQHGGHASSGGRGHCGGQRAQQAGD